MTSSQNHSDIKQNGFIRYFPRSIRRYAYMMRMDRPIGTWLLLIPSSWGIIIAGGLSDWSLIALFCLGAFIMRGAGCIVNDLWDKNLDKQVERTKSRPLPAGDVTVKQALLFLSLLSLIGLVILLQMNFLTILIGLFSVFLVILYPYMKRITWWPQLFLGFTFNIGAIMGYTAVTGEISVVPVILYMAGIFWTLGYDTIYACQDFEDDSLVGIKSTARLFIEKTGQVKKPIAVFYLCHIICLGILFSFIEPVERMLGFFLLAFSSLHLVWQVVTLNHVDPMNALNRFRSNKIYGLIIALLFCVIMII